ncbi:hypothetical protein KC318_g6267 [Hortaea werneckii]|nr:hypothetical protein KC334_g6012 [Hortaea werneckii]KAI7010270.1 hypothetical protein KC355_g6250 [Hortaea werneckii]KAI7666821.1 hypothetical protein KC318_g6267 [Hortaea werneckii]
MVRTAQTARTEGPDVIHNRTFTDHAGNTAIRARWSIMAEPIPGDFHTAESGTGSDFSGTALEEVLGYVGCHGGSGWRRDSPGWEIYSVENVGGLECVEHQYWEIASRKERREDSGVNPILKVAHWDCLRDAPEKLGFLMVVDSASFNHGDAMTRSGVGPQWVFFDRHTPTSMEWSVESRLDEDPDFLASRVCEPPRAPTVLPERLDTEVVRVQQKPGDMEEQLSWIHHSSSVADGSNDPPAAGLEDIMDVGWRETEGNPDEVKQEPNAANALRDSAAQLNIGGLSIKRDSPPNIVISNAPKGADPDLRYVIYIPFLTGGRTMVTLEKAAKAFTQAVTSRFSGELPKTVHFEIHKPTSADKTSMLRHYQSRGYPSDFTGALTTFPNRAGEANQKGMRAQPIARTEYAARNDPEAVDFEPYRTFLIILEEPDFPTVPGRVPFLLADGGKYEVEDEPDQDYPETLLWRCAGIEEVSRRLQMMRGGVKWEKST